MDILINELKDNLEISLSKEKVSKLLKYQELLIEWNKNINLTAIKSPEEIQIKHFLDSLYVSLVWKGTSVPKRMIDVGTGAGFPGIVLSIVFPEIHMTVVESVGKKSAFCSFVIETLKLSSVKVITERAEVVAHMSEQRENYDVAVARAVAPLNILSEYLLPFVHKDGVVVAMKGANAESEVTQAQGAIQALGGVYSRSIEYMLPHEHTPRSLVLLHKTKTTSTSFPREVGVPAKLPLR